jgi:hypothetical protein
MNHISSEILRVQFSLVAIPYTRIAAGHVARIHGAQRVHNGIDTIRYADIRAERVAQGRDTPASGGGPAEKDAELVVANELQLLGNGLILAIDIFALAAWRRMLARNEIAGRLCRSRS